jgi:hypothetical protein
MDLVLKTMDKVVISITTKEIENKGFEHFWDTIRGAYPAEKYDVHSIGALKDNAKDIYIELVSKRLRE